MIAQRRQSLTLLVFGIVMAFAIPFLIAYEGSPVTGAPVSAAH